MTEIEQQILINQIMIMEAMIHNFHKNNDYDCVCRNLELRASDTYYLLKKNRSENEYDGE